MKGKGRWNLRKERDEGMKEGRKDGRKVKKGWKEGK